MWRTLGVLGLDWGIGDLTLFMIGLGKDGARHVLENTVALKLSCS
jgi:hypothetical protein